MLPEKPGIDPDDLCHTAAQDHEALCLKSYCQMMLVLFVF